MIILGANWADIIAWNLRIAGALWAAWGGGLSSAVYGSVRMNSTVQCEGLLPGVEIGVEPAEPIEADQDQPRRHLTLVE